MQFVKDIITDIKLDNKMRADYNNPRIYIHDTYVIVFIFGYFFIINSDNYNRIIPFIPIDVVDLHNGFNLINTGTYTLIPQANMNSDIMFKVGLYNYIKYINTNKKTINKQKKLNKSLKKFLHSLNAFSSNYYRVSYKDAYYINGLIKSDIQAYHTLNSVNMFHYIVKSLNEIITPNVSIKYDKMQLATKGKQLTLYNATNGQNCGHFLIGFKTSKHGNYIIDAVISNIRVIDFTIINDIYLLSDFICLLKLSSNERIVLTSNLEDADITPLYLTITDTKLVEIIKRSEIKIGRIMY